jgi:hypothetical protein
MIKKLLIIVVIFFALLGVLFGILWISFKNGRLQEFAVDTVLNQFVKNDQNSSSSTINAVQETNFIKKLLGFNGEKTYLVLLLNNTELRPGGGFIGSYATINLDHGVPHILKVEGTEVLDYSAYPTNFLSVPPTPFTTFLKLDRWYFRDSNWSPDFSSSASTSLDLYQKEQGVAAGDVKVVVGITTTVLEELLKITGPVTVNGEEFTSANVVEKLEYAVEHDYQNQGLTLANRKQILGDLVKVMSQKLATDAFTHWSDYFSLAERMLKEKQVALYAVDPTDQNVITTKGWGGDMKQAFPGDYVMWVDANLGALKTDAVMKRTLRYIITPSGGNYVATVLMNYTHTGKSDWRTTRYLTYVRLYVPLGSQLITSHGFTKNGVGVANAPLDIGVENGREWFGGFTSVEPLSSKEVMIQFVVAPSVAEEIMKGNYQLLVQKQIGTINPTLTLQMDFGKSIITAIPVTEQSGGKYMVVTDLKSDKEFHVQLQ